MRTLRSLRQNVSSLSGGQRQTVAIARAVLWNSKLVILDEPTAALGVAQTEQVLNLVRRLADNGLGVVLITHNMNDVFQVADTIACLYLGQMAAQVRAKDVNNTQVIELITAGRSGEPRARSPAAAEAGVAYEHHRDTTARLAVRPRDDARQGGIGEAAGAYWDRIKGGDLGALPAILGVVVLVIVFGVMEPDSFLTEQNFANLLNQGAAIMVLAMGLVFVLLLGEIDLSAGFTAGTGAAILGVTLTEHGWAWPLVGARRAAPRVWRSASRSRCWWRGWASRLRRVAGLLPGPAGRDAADHRRGRDDPDPQRRDPRGDEQEHAGRRSAGCSR